MEYEILLINVSRDMIGNSESFRDSIGQYLIASYLRLHAFKGYVYAGNVENCKKVIEQELLDNKVPVVGFYAAADNIRVVKNAVIWLKKKFKKVKTIIGGPQAMALDYTFFEETGNDYAIIGEGEIPIRMLLTAEIDNLCTLEEVPSLVYMDKENRVLRQNSQEGAIIEDLDMLPHPNLIDSLKRDLRTGSMVGIITGRGCPYRCTFCYEGANAKNVRLRSIENVMQEIDYICENNHHLQYLSIYDDTFTLNKDRVLEFCNEIEKRKIKWYCEGHISFVLKHPDVIKRMVEAGLVCIQFGIESGSNQVLEAYNKHTNFDMIVEAIRICKEAGIHGITGNFIIGGAFESRETIEESKHLLRELVEAAKGIVELYAVYFAPYPNTRISTKPEMFDVERNTMLEQYCLNSMHSPVVRTKELTTEEIYAIKHEFEEYVADCYQKAAKNPMKADVLQGMSYNGRRIHINPTWEKIYNEKAYIRTFVEHISEVEQIFCAENYMIRTFEDFVFDGDKIVSEAGEFVGLEKDVLIHAVGELTANQMAKLFEKDIKEIENVFMELNNRCLVYMSKF